MSGDAGVQGGPARIRGRGGVCCVIAVWCEPFLWGWQSFFFDVGMAEFRSPPKIA